jgi:GH15 family glucan-1,4-alpha-glucosidase
MAMRQVVGEVPQGASPWPPIASDAFLSDCEACTLVAPCGNVEWLCLPRFDGPSIFGSILDRDVGASRLPPVVRCVNGPVDIRMECEPRADYGLETVVWDYGGKGYSSAVTPPGKVGLSLGLTTDLRLHFEGGSARARTTMREGDIEEES